MEEQENNSPEPANPGINQPQQSTMATPIGTSLPNAPKRKRGKGKLAPILAGLVLIAAVGVGLFFIGKAKNKSGASPSPSPGVEGLQVVDTTPEPIGTAEPVDKAEVKIEILNGTGIAGEASYLQGKLKALGYEIIDVGNASDQDYEVTTVTFSSDLSETIVEEITQELEDIYREVSTKKSRSASIDIQIITGLRKGATAKPSATPEPEETSTPTSSPTTSPTSTASPAPSPTG